MTTAKKYLLVVLALEGFSLLAGIVVALVVIATTYDGRCGGIIMIPGFASVTHPCSFFEHMAHYSGMAATVALLILFYFWLVSVPMLLLAVLAPLIAYKIGRRRSVMAAGGQTDLDAGSK